MTLFSARRRRHRRRSLRLLHNVQPPGTPPTTTASIDTDYPAMASKASGDWSADLFGPKLLAKPQTSGIPTASAIAGKKLVVLYFSASWCPPCRSFSPLLIEFYEKCKEDLAVVFVSSDQDEKSFGGYFGKMPWNAMFPSYTNKENRDRQGRLASMFKIQGIPTVIVLDAKTGHFITDNARAEVMQATSDASKKELVRSWLSKEAVPIDQAVFGSSEESLLVRVVKGILTRPAYIFGIIYMVKQLLKYLERMGKDGIEDGKEL